MSKTGKTVTKATYGLLGIIAKPIYDQMRKETRLLDKRWYDINNRASQDAEAERRTFQVHQMQDPIVHVRGLW